jgi:hypothetical protein
MKNVIAGFNTILSTDFGIIEGIELKNGLILIWDIIGELEFKVGNIDMIQKLELNWI